jgi:hypothetical protein
MKRAGIKNMKVINESISKIEMLTKFYKKKRMSEETYIRGVHEALSKLTDERDYIEYLSNIGQL